MAAKEEMYSSNRGTRIFFRVWHPSGPPRAIVVINHGVNSHSGHYLWAGEQFAAAGFITYAIDMRGRGKSEGRRFSVDDISEYVDDLNRLVYLAKRRAPELPVYLLGHSAGGVVSCVYALEKPDMLEGLICESFAYRVPAPAPVLAIVRLLAQIAPKTPVLKLKNKFFSRDPEVVERLERDPLIKGEAQPARTVAALLRGTDRMKKEFSSITMPVLIMHGTKDKVTVPAGSKYFHEHAGSADNTLKLYEGHYHDLLSDYGKEEVMADIVAWIEARLPVPEAAPAP